MNIRDKLNRFGTILFIFVFVFVTVTPGYAGNPTAQPEPGGSSTICDPCIPIATKLYNLGPSNFDDPQWAQAYKTLESELQLCIETYCKSRVQEKPRAITITIKVKATEEVLQAGKNVDQPLADANIRIVPSQTPALPGQGPRDVERAHNLGPNQSLTDPDGNAIFYLPVVYNEIGASDQSYEISDDEPAADPDGANKTSQGTSPADSADEEKRARDLVADAARNDRTEPVYQFVDEALKEEDIALLWVVVDSIVAQGSSAKKPLREGVLNYTLDKIVQLEDPIGYATRTAYEQAAKNFPKRYGNQILAPLTQQTPLMLRDFRISELLQQKAALNLWKEGAGDATTDSVYTAIDDQQLIGVLRRLNEIGAEIAELNRTMPYAANALARAERKKKQDRIAELQQERDRLLAIPGVAANDAWRKARDKKIEDLIAQSKVIADKNKVLEDALDELQFIKAMRNWMPKKDWIPKHKEAEDKVSRARDDYLRSLNHDALLTTEVDGIPLWRKIQEIEESGKSDEEKHRLIDEALTKAIDRLDDRINEQIAHLSEMRTFEELTEEFSLKIYDSFLDRAAKYYAQFYGPIAYAVFGALRSAFQAQEDEDEYWKLLLRGGEAAVLAITIPFPVVGLGVAIVSAGMEGGRTIYVWSDLSAAEGATAAGGLDYRSLYHYQQEFSTQRFAFGLSIALLPLDAFAALASVVQARITRIAKLTETIQDAEKELAAIAKGEKVVSDSEKQALIARTQKKIDEAQAELAQLTGKGSSAEEAAEPAVAKSDFHDAKTEIASERLGANQDAGARSPGAAPVQKGGTQAFVPEVEGDIGNPINDLWNKVREYNAEVTAQAQGRADRIRLIGLQKEILEIVEQLKGTTVVIPGLKPGQAPQRVILGDWIGGGTFGQVFRVLNPDGTLIDDVVVKIFYTPDAYRESVAAAAGQVQGAKVLDNIKDNPIYSPKILAANPEGGPPVLVLRKYPDGWYQVGGRKLTPEEMEKIVKSDMFLSNNNVKYEDGHVANRIFHPDEDYAGVAEQHRIFGPGDESEELETIVDFWSDNPEKYGLDNLERIPSYDERVKFLEDAHNFRRTMWEQKGLIVYQEGVDRAGKPVFGLVNEGELDLHIVKKYDPDLVRGKVYKRVGTDANGNPILELDPDFSDATLRASVEKSAATALPSPSSTPQPRESPKKIPAVGGTISKSAALNPDPEDEDTFNLARQVSRASREMAEAKKALKENDEQGFSKAVEALDEIAREMFEASKYYADKDPQTAKKWASNAAAAERAVRKLLDQSKEESKDESADESKKDDQQASTKTSLPVGLEFDRSDCAYGGGDTIYTISTMVDSSNPIINTSVDVTPRSGLIFATPKNGNPSLPDELSSYQDHSFELSDYIIHAVRFPAGMEDEIRKIINRIPNVVYVEINFCRTKATLDDPYWQSRSSWKQDYDDQWAIKRVGFGSAQDSVWSLAEKGSPVPVAVIDTGMDWNHLDMSWDNIWNNDDEIPENGKDDDKNGYIDDMIGWDFIGKNNKPWDRDGHGTFVGGVIAATRNNGAGIAGINPNAKIMVLKALNNFGHTRASYLAEAIVYAANNSARVINISAGGQHLTRTEQMAVDYAYSKGAIVVVAAGNEAVEVIDYCPAGLRNVLTVAATNFNDSRAVYSNYGAGIDISAPGDDVLSLRARQTDLMRDIPGVQYASESAYIGKDKRYYRASGTSFAAPIVAGAASLIFSMNPQLTNEEVERMLLYSATDIDVPGKDQHTGFGVLNAVAAAKADPNFFMITEIRSVEAISKEGMFFVEVNGTADANQFKNAHIEIGAGKNPAQWKRISGDLSRSVKEGTLGAFPASELAGSADWTIRLVVEDQNGRTREGRMFLHLE